MLEVLYHHAKFRGDRISSATGAEKNVEFFCMSVTLFSKRQRITLRSLHAIARPSVVCLSSVTFAHPTQPVKHFGNFFSSSPSDNMAIH